jgi:hypothetical protein
LYYSREVKQRKKTKSGKRKKKTKGKIVRSKGDTTTGPMEIK